jgi:hypothetical protein
VLQKSSLRQAFVYRGCVAPAQPALFPWINNNPGKSASIAMRRESIEVYVSQGSSSGTQRKRLFYIVDSKSDPVGAVKVEAGQSGLIPILSGTRMCRFAIQDDADKTLVSRKPERAKQ